MGRRSQRLRPFPPAPSLFPIKGAVRSAIDLLPIVPDPTGRGARAWSILSRLPITEGEHAGKRIGENAPPWQERLVKLIFGHTDEFGLRVLREAFVCIGKKNSKTTFGGALGVTKLLLEEEQREQIICLAAKKEQAAIAFDSMAALIRADEELLPRFEIVDYRKMIRYPATNSTAKAIPAEEASVVGGNVSFALVDELHLLGATPKGAKLVNQIRTGNVARKEPLLVSISTQPIERSAGIFESTMAKARRVLSGEEVDPRFFAWICEIPSHLDPEDPRNWHWSNPSLGYTVTLDRLREMHESAKSDPATLRDFRSQNLNIAPDESAGIGRWMPVAEWDACADAGLDLDAVIDQAERLVIGTDAGGLDDLSAISVLGKTEGGALLLWSRQWISRRGYEKRKSTNDYDAFVAAGELTIFEGGGEDIQAMAEVARAVDASGKLRLVGIDSYAAPELAAALAGLSAEVQAVPQGWKLTPAISWLERRIADRELRHCGSKLLRWNVGNAVVTRQGNASSITKATAVGGGKIDGLAATLNAAAAMIVVPEPVRSVYDTMTDEEAAQLGLSPIGDGSGVTVGPWDDDDDD
jgi:phage terminase large subunit-like protein